MALLRNGIPYQCINSAFLPLPSSTVLRFPPPPSRYALAYRALPVFRAPLLTSDLFLLDLVRSFLEFFAKDAHFPLNDPRAGIESFVPPWPASLEGEGRPGVLAPKP